jgi:hypothetical protein
MYYLHRIENHQCDTKYYTDEKIKEIKNEITAITPKTIAMEKLITDIKIQIGIDIPKQVCKEQFYYITDWENTFTKQYLIIFSNELIELKQTIKSQLLNDVFDWIIEEYRESE